MASEVKVTLKKSPIGRKAYFSKSPERAWAESSASDSHFTGHSGNPWNDP